MWRTGGPFLVAAVIAQPVDVLVNHIGLHKHEVVAGLILTLGLGVIISEAIRAGYLRRTRKRP